MFDSRISTLLSLLLLTGVGLASPEPGEAQERSAWLAVRQCKIKPTEGRALREAFREFGEYARANPGEDIPGQVYGSFRQRVWGDANFTTVYEVDSVAEYDGWVRRRLARMESDERWGELWRAWTEHLVPQSCQVSFHQRWP